MKHPNLYNWTLFEVLNSTYILYIKHTLHIFIKKTKLDLRAYTADELYVAILCCHYFITF